MARAFLALGAFDVTRAAVTCSGAGVSWSCDCAETGSNSTVPITGCLQHCFDRCHSELPQQATVSFKAGVFHTGSLVIPSNTTLVLSADATLLGSMDPAEYPLVQALPSYGVSRDCCCNDWTRYNCSGGGGELRHRALLTTEKGAENIAIKGAGIVDGNGWPWWMRFETFGLDAGRPSLFEPLFAKNVQLEGTDGQLWFKDSAFWSLHPYACDGVILRNLKITADRAHGHNTDGIDPDSTRNVLVENCYVDVGDDAVAIKSGIDFAGRQFGVPSENMLFRHNHFASRHIAIGSEESGGVRNVTFVDNILGVEGQSTLAGIHLKAERGRGGYIRDVTFRGLDIRGQVNGPLLVSLFYSDDRPRTNATATPAFGDITIQDVFIHEASDIDGWAGQFVGLPEAPIDSLHLRNITARNTHGNSSRAAWICSNIASGDASVMEPSLDITSCSLSMVAVVV